MPSHYNDYDDEFEDDPRDEGETHKPSNKVALPDAQKVDLANVKFPRRSDLSLPDGPALDAVRLNSRNEGRARVPLPEHEMDAHLTTREDGGQAVDARSSLPVPGRVSRIMRSNSDGFELPASQMDIAKLGMRRRDGLGLGDTGRNAVQGVL